MGGFVYFGWEIDLMEWLQLHASPLIVTVSKLCSMLGEEMLLVALLGFLYWDYDKRIGVSVGRSLLTCFSWNTIMKNLVLRLRPYMVSNRVKCLMPVDPGADLFDISAQGYSFPSGHSSNSASAYLSAALRLKKRWITVLAAAVVFLIGVSRFMVGVHYPTDVLAGWLLGILVVLFISVLEKKVHSLPLLYGILLLTGLAGLFICHTDDYFSAYGMLIGLALGDMTEQRFVRFENTRKPLFMILRLVGGLAIFFGCNTLLKLPFSSEFLASGTQAAHAVRLLRYALVIYVLIGVYPRLFALVEKTKTSKA